MLLLGFEVPLWMILTGSFAVLVYLHNKKKFNHFKKSNLPGSRVWPVLGTTMELYKKNFMSMDLMMRKKYGKFVRTFDGSTPVLMVYDAEWLREAFVKHLSVFTNRRRVVFGRALDYTLFVSEGDHWRHTRRIVSPEFSSGKIKRMMPTIQDCILLFVSNLDKSNEKPIYFRRNCYGLLLDIVSHTAFELESDTQTNEDSKFTKNALRLVNNAEYKKTLTQKLITGLALILFIWAPTWVVRLAANSFNIALLDIEALGYLEQICEKVIANRKSGSPEPSFVQTLVDSLVEAPKGHPDTLVDTNGLLWSKQGLTSQGIVGNALVFLTAGFVTTSNTLLFAFYELAQHPHIQEQLYEEIMEIFHTDDITPEQINEAKLLEYCINETLRLYPIGFRFDRATTEDVTIRDIFVPKGTMVTAAPWTIHREPEIWEHPEEYDPYRFLPDRFTQKQNTAYMPFGIGNRACIGQRLAQLEMKMTLILTLKKFIVCTCEDTPERPIKFAPVPAITPEKKIMLRFVNR